MSTLKLMLKVGCINFHLHKNQQIAHQYGSSDKFALAMFQRSAPTLLAYDGTYAKLREMNVKDILPFSFPFGIGGPKMRQKVKVSKELCIQLYIRLSF